VVIWTALSRNDLKAIHAHIALDSQFYAGKVVGDILDRTEKVSFMPEVGRVVPETADPAIREIFVHSYRIIFQLTNCDIAVVAVVHGHRDTSSGIPGLI